MDMPTCQRCSQKVGVLTTLLTALSVENGVATVSVDTGLFLDLGDDDLRCGCTEAPELIGDDYVAVYAICEYVANNAAPELDVSLPDEVEVVNR